MVASRPTILAASDKPGERRHSTRKSVVWPAKLAADKGWIDCQVIDLSPLGAKVRIQGPFAGSDQTQLSIEQLGLFDCSVIWQTKSYIGVHFDRLPADAEPQSGALSRVQMISMRARKRENAPAGALQAEVVAKLADMTAAQVPEPAPEPAPMLRRLRAAPLQRAVRTPQPMPIPSDDPVVTAAVAIILPEIINQIKAESVSTLSREELEAELGHFVQAIGAQQRLSLSAAEEAAVTLKVIDEMLGLGPLEPLIADNSVSDILVNGHQKVYVERRGKLSLTDVKFPSERHVRNIASRIVSRVGRRVDESTPIADARLDDGSRVNIILPPLSLHGTIISIRKFPFSEITLERMVQTGSMSVAMAVLLKIAAKCRLNILISGGTGSGKTTMLNAVSQMIEPDERIVTIEDAAELQLQLPHVISLETRPPNLEDEGEVSMRDLFRNALRMRPDRIILGEIRSEEAYDVLQAMNTGHDGSLATIHASSARAALTRLENILSMTTSGIPANALRRQISSAVDLVVQVSRMRDGKRRIVCISEIVGHEGEVTTTQELFTFEAEPYVSGQELKGRFAPGNYRPHFIDKAEGVGLAGLLLKATAQADSCTLADLTGR